MKYILTLLLFFTINLNAFYTTEAEFNEKVYVQTYGNIKNEAIVFVHGTGDEASSNWDKSIAQLKDKYYILTFDLPGFGKSKNENRNTNQLYSISRYVEFIHNMTNRYIKKKYHLIGHSMGGAISLKYAHKYQKELESLVLIDAAGILSKEAFTQFMVKNGVTGVFGKKAKEFGLDTAIAKITAFVESILPIEIEDLIESPNMRKYILQSNAKAVSAISLVNEDFSEIPEEIYVNTRIIWGKDDGVAPLRTGYVLNKLIKNSKMNIIEGAKHVPIVNAFPEYISYIKEHLQFPYYRKLLKDNMINDYKKNVILKGANGIRLSGNIDEIELVDCKNITIKDARINKLTITNSDVHIIDSIFNINKTSHIVDSTFTVTSSTINYKAEVELYNSNLDFAGVDIHSSGNSFINLNTQDTQKIIFSLSTSKSKSLHGEYTLKVNKVNPKELPIFY